jgi:phosphoglycerol transferase
MGAIVATQCGIPLKMNMVEDVRRNKEGRSFLAGATCLGDVLQARGYRNVFMGGAGLAFSGKGVFLQDHGYQEARGLGDWLAQEAPREDLGLWGLYDDALFARARQRLLELHAKGEPFNLTLLTLDSHAPSGFLSPRCRRAGGKDYTDAILCSTEQVARFAEFVRDQGLLKDTVLVIVGDHLAMPNDVSAKLESRQEDRRMYNLFITDGRLQPNATELLPFDLYPTLLELLGTEVGGDRLALGYSAVGAISAPRPAGRAQQWSRNALRSSPVYDKLWENPQ